MIDTLTLNNELATCKGIKKKKVICFWLHWVFVAVPSTLWLWQWGLPFLMVLGLLLVVGSPAAGSRLLSACSVIVAHRLFCPVACGIFPDKGWMELVVSPAMAGGSVTTRPPGKL